MCLISFLIDQIIPSFHVNTRTACESLVSDVDGAKKSKN